MVAERSEGEEQGGQGGWIRIRWEIWQGGWAGWRQAWRPVNISLGFGDVLFFLI